jgi:hypothetical protein
MAAQGRAHERQASMQNPEGLSTVCARNWLVKNKLRDVEVGSP